VLVAAGAVAGVAFQSARGQPGAAGASATPSTSTPAVLPIVIPAEPPGTLPNGVSRKPKLVVSQPNGDGDTVFVVHGSGFVPFTPVRIELVGVGISPDRPVTDRKGTFNYAIDQGHVFFRGLIPVGEYQVVALGARGRQASTSFQVVPLGPPGSGSPPPGT
jgi:hypothetical protein